MTEEVIEQKAKKANQKGSDNRRTKTPHSEAFHERGSPILYVIRRILCSWLRQSNDYQIKISSHGQLDSLAEVLLC